MQGLASGVGGGGEERETGVGRSRDERMKAEVDAAERV